ncbi:MAG: rhodanese-like domain-containing protein [Planctomycetota bacterium]|jgi:hypothetical protein
MWDSIVIPLVVVSLVAFAGCTPSRENGEGSGSKTEPGGGGAITSPEGVPRVSPEETHRKVQNGEALLVCAYDDARFESVKLEGAIPLGSLDKELEARGKNAEIIFYCA